MSSLLKHAEDPDVVRGNGRGRLSFNRAHIDGVPFRGPQALLREDEWDEYTETVNDGYVSLFDLANPEHHKKLQQIFDAAANNWYKVHRMTEQFVPQPDGTLKVYVYCVWVEPHKELAKHRMPVGALQETSRL